MTIGIEMTDNEAVQLTEHNYRDLCRLCLRADDDCIVDVFSRCENNATKRPLIDRLNDLYQIKLQQSDGMPSKICHSCLYNTELFYDFRAGVHECERKLSAFVQTLAIQPIQIEPQVDLPASAAQTQPMHDVSEGPSDVVIIDPLKCYESSSDEEGDDDDVVEVNANSTDKAKYELLATMYNRLALPPNTAVDSPAINKSSSIDASEQFRNMLFCKYCEAAFTDQQQCEAHEKNNHDPISPFACNFCQFRCDSRFNVIAHIKQFHEPEKPYVCVQCNKNFGRRADLKKHAVMHTGVRPFECAVCKKSFSRKSNLIKHAKTHGEQPTVPVEPLKPHQCEICWTRFTDLDELNEHQRKHIQERYAQLQMDAWNQLQQNQKMQQTTLLAQSTLPPATTTPSKAAPKYSIQCTMSPDTDGSQIPKLKLTKKLQNSFGCDKCDKVFATPTSLKSHKRVHAVVKPLACTTCNITFKTKRELQRHNVMHAGQKKFNCSVCQKEFARRDKMVRHEKTHSNRKKTAALPEAAFFPENLKRTSQYNIDNRLAQQQQHPAAKDMVQLPPLRPEMFRPQFYAEYDLSQT